MLVGWLWADLLLALFAIFAVANTFGAPPALAKPTITPVPTPQATATPAPQSPTASPAPGIDPTAVELSVQADAAAVLSADPTVVAAERTRVVARAQAALGPNAQRRAAVSSALS